WAPLLDGNPFVDELILVDRSSVASLARSFRELRRKRFDFAIDFQGLIQSALVATFARAERIYGFHRSQTRERPATLFYSSCTLSPAKHVVDRNLDLARAAGASSVLRVFPIPPGSPENVLPAGDFVLASPFAGWASKQWPLDYYSSLALRFERELGA